MSFGLNLQFLRKMHGGMTQEKLAEKMGVSRQTISKWEMDAAFPEMEKAALLCDFFNCSLDELIRGNINTDDPAYRNIRVEAVNSFAYISYAVISEEPEEDAKNHIKGWVLRSGLENLQIIGWNFPFVSQEQVNVHHMHGYAAACILPEHFEHNNLKIHRQPAHKYAAITIRDPFVNPFVLIPNAYKTLMRYMEVNQLKCKEEKDLLSCFEREYCTDGILYMDIFLAIES